MPVPDGLAGSKPMAVEGRQGLKIKERLRFGAYDAHQIRRSWTKGSDFIILVYEGNKRLQRYSFVLREQQTDRWNVSCEAFLRKRTIHGPLDAELTNRSALNCRLESIGDSTDVWQLSLFEKRERPLIGELTRGDTRLLVQGSRKLLKGLPNETTTGYLVIDAERPVAAVEVINDGAVWLDRAVPHDTQSLLSATAATLLLLEDLRVHLPETVATAR